MSLPSTSNKPSQSSIRSFFVSQPPKYAPPPPSSKIIPPPGSASASRVSSSQTSTSSPPPSIKVTAAITTAPATTSSPGIAGQPRQDASVTATPPEERHIPALPTYLPPEAAVRPLREDDIPPLRRLNALLLPVSYPDLFYTHALRDPFSRVITWQHADSEPKVVGAVVCRLEPETAPLPNQEQSLYIRSLCLLSPYRGFGLVSAALDNITGEAIADKNVDVKAITAHVWTENEEGLKWYGNRGFNKIGEPISGYYFKLRPNTAFLVSKDIGASVLAALTTSKRQQCPEPDEIRVVTKADEPSKRPEPPKHGQSYQNQKTDMEWNDLPMDMAPGVRAMKMVSAPGSGASSRSSSAARKKRDRSYPAAAFGAS